MLEDIDSRRIDHFFELEERINTYFWEEWILTQKMGANFLAEYRSAFAMREIERAVRMCEKYQAIFEHHLRRITRHRDECFPALLDAVPTDTWDHIQSALNESKDTILNRIESEMAETSPSREMVCTGAGLFVDDVVGKNGRVKKEVKQNVGRNENLYTKLIDILGEIACTILYIRLCSRIIIGHGVSHDSNTMKNGDQTCRTRKHELYLALQDKEYARAGRIGRDLVLNAEIVASWHASNIADHHRQRLASAYDHLRRASLADELDEIELMKERIMDYALGMYFSTASDDMLKREGRYARKLEYDKPTDAPDVVGVTELLTSPRRFLDKQITLMGTVSAVDDIKWFVRGHEAVMSKFTVTDGSQTVLAVRFGAMLRDNGLEPGALVTLTGTFEKNTHDEEHDYQVKIDSFPYRKLRRESWTDRCRWLAGQWWDNGTDNARCNWTFYPATGYQLMDLGLSHTPIMDPDELNERLEEVRNTNHIAKAAINIGKNVRRNIFYRTFAEKIKSTQTKSIAIDKALAEIKTGEGR